MQRIVANSNKATTIYNVSATSLDVFKQLSDVNSCVTVSGNLIAYTVENNVVHIANSDGVELVMIILKDDIKAMEFSPLGTYLQIVTYQETTENLFVYDAKTGQELHKARKFVPKTTNVDHQPFLVVFSSNEKLIAAQLKHQILYLNADFQPTDQAVQFFPEDKKYTQLSYCFSGQYLVAAVTASKDQMGKIAVYNGPEFITGHTNPKVNRVFFQPSEQYCLARLCFDEGATYYGSTQLLFLNFPQRKASLIIPDFLNSSVIFRPKNGAGTEVIITSAKNPAAIQFTTVTYHKQSNSLITATANYQHAVHINSITANGDVIIMRGEAGFDGLVYLGYWCGNRVKIVGMKEQRDITHVHIMRDTVLFSTQKPRFHVDNSIYLNDIPLKQQKKVDYEGLRYIAVLGENEPNVALLEKLPEIVMKAGDPEKVAVKEVAYVPPQARQEQQQKEQAPAQGRRGGFF